MSALLDRLLGQLERRGLRVEPGDNPGELKLLGDTRAADETVMLALKAFKPQLLERFGRREPKTETLDREPPTQPAPVAAPEPPPQAAACTGCGREVDFKKRCWHCCNRPCVTCGKMTGSAFIGMCDICAAKESRDESERLSGR